MGNALRSRMAARRASACLLIAAAMALAACQSADIVETAELAPADDAPIFSERVFGVPASPRVTNLRNVRKGGGRDHVGKPYKVRGTWYYPKDEPGYVGTGKASWYGANFHGRLTANGEVYDMFGLSAAHTTFPLPSYAMVTNLRNGSKVMVRVNDRGPFAHGREIDLSSKAAEMLGFRNAGVTDVKVEYVGRAPLDGNDTPTLMASFRPGASAPAGTPDQMMVASLERPASRGAASASAPSALPGVRPLDAMMAEPAPAGVPVPLGADRGVPSSLAFAASLASSYAAAGSPSPAAAALDALAGAPSGSLVSHTIAVGAVPDAESIDRIRAVVAGRGELRVDASADGAPELTLALAPEADVDAVLQGLWQAGARDAFILRD